MPLFSLCFLWTCRRKSEVRETLLSVTLLCSHRVVSSLHVRSFAMLGCLRLVWLAEPSTLCSLLRGLRSSRSPSSFEQTRRYFQDRAIHQCPYWCCWLRVPRSERFRYVFPTRCLFTSWIDQARTRAPFPSLSASYPSSNSQSTSLDFQQRMAGSFQQTCKGDEPQSHLRYCPPFRKPLCVVPKTQQLCALSPPHRYLVGGLLWKRLRIKVDFLFTLFYTQRIELIYCRFCSASRVFFSKLRESTSLTTSVVYPACIWFGYPRHAYELILLRGCVQPRFNLSSKPLSLARAGQSRPVAIDSANQTPPITLSGLRPQAAS